MNPPKNIELVSFELVPPPVALLTFAHLSAYVLVTLTLHENAALLIAACKRCMFTNKENHTGNRFSLPYYILQLVQLIDL